MRGPVWRFAAERVAEAYRRGLSVREACDAWYSGAYLLETVPTVLYILMRHAADPEEAIVRAVNDTRDNDTVAAIVGSAVGALHGRQGLPLRWLDGLSGRTREADSARVFALLAEARLAFWESVPSPCRPIRRRPWSASSRSLPCRSPPIPLPSARTMPRTGSCPALPGGRVPRRRRRGQGAQRLRLSARRGGPLYRPHRGG